MAKTTNIPEIVAELTQKAQIQNAIAWYQKHKSEIQAAIPIKTPGKTFSAKWIETIERYIGLWERGELPNPEKSSGAVDKFFLSTSYITAPLRTIRDALADNNKP